MPRLRTMYRRHKIHAKQRGIGHRLTLVQFISLLVRSGHLFDYGRGCDKYCIARHGDQGIYEIGNVKVITNAENTREQKPHVHTAEQRAKMSANNPMRRAEVRAKVSGDNSSAKRPEVRAKRMGNKYAVGNKNWVGRTHSAESRAKSSAAKMGSKNPMSTENRARRQREQTRAA